MGPMRLQQFLARAGIASRRKAEALIRAGRVTINGEVAELGRVVQPGDVVRLDGERVNPPRKTVVIALNKPRGYTTTHEDPHAEKRVYSLVPAHPGLHAVGRLDKETEGLLLLTNDGQLTQLLTHPRNQVPKVYRAWCKNGRLSLEACRRLEQGVALEDGPAKALRAIPARGGARLVLTEGRKREVRRMLARVGYPVERLVRLAVGPIELGGLEPGQWRYLSPGEVRLLRQSAHTRPAAPDVESERERVPKRSGKGTDQPRTDRRAHPSAGAGDKTRL
ncbi:pseudouridine synthase [Meiothermus luteus]|nr:pseudouridine synthase [Meiothermus luteus]